MVDVIVVEVVAVNLRRAYPFVAYCASFLKLPLTKSGRVSLLAPPAQTCSRPPDRTRPPCSRPDDMLVLGLTALRPRAAGRPAVRMDQGVTAPEDDDAELLKRMAQQRLLGKTETQVHRTSWTPLALPLHESRTRAAAHLHRPPSRHSSGCVTSAPPADPRGDGQVRDGSRHGLELFR